MRIEKVREANRKLQGIVQQRTTEAKKADELYNKEVEYTRAAVHEMLPRSPDQPVPDPLHMYTLGSQSCEIHVTQTKAKGKDLVEEVATPPKAQALAALADDAQALVSQIQRRKRGRPPLTAEEKKGQSGEASISDKYAPRAAETSGDP